MLLLASGPSLLLLRPADPHTRYGTVTFYVVALPRRSRCVSHDVVRRSSLAERLSCSRLKRHTRANLTTAGLPKATPEANGRSYRTAYGEPRTA